MVKTLLLFVILGYVSFVATYVSANEDSNKNLVLFSNVDEDEHVVFFQTSAWLNEDQTNWMVPIHGWVYEPQDSQIRKDVVARLLDKTYEIQTTEEAEPNFSSRVNLLLADNERSKNIIINLAGRNYLMPASDAHGHFETILEIPTGDVSSVDGNMLHYSAVLAISDERIFRGEIQLIKPLGRSVISDIDDTVKLSYVTDRAQLIDATFNKDFTAVDGMAELYNNLEQQGVNFHFVSSSPWQLYTPLKDFLSSANFPWATMSLKKIRFRDQTILDLFKKGTETKPQAIEAILQRYPNRRFVLIGDSGEQDAQVYAIIAKKYPQQIDKILIRDVGNNSSLTVNYKEIFSGISVIKWQVFVSPNDINI